MSRTRTALYVLALPAYMLASSGLVEWAAGLFT